jgi:hypothetical protein
MLAAFKLLQPLDVQPPVAKDVVTASSGTPARLPAAPHQNQWAGSIPQS